MADSLSLKTYVRFTCSANRTSEAFAANAVQLALHLPHLCVVVELVKPSTAKCVFSGTSLCTHNRLISITRVGVGGGDVN